jgi:hypothetical protein
VREQVLAGMAPDCWRKAIPTISRTHARELVPISGYKRPCAPKLITNRQVRLDLALLSIVQGETTERHLA